MKESERLMKDDGKMIIELYYIELTDFNPDNCERCVFQHSKYEDTGSNYQKQVISQISCHLASNEVYRPPRW